MTPALIEPAAAAGASAAHALLSANLMPSLSPASMRSQAGAGQATAFQTHLAGLQTQGVQGLVGMRSGDLQQLLTSLNPQQRLSLSQQLMGSTVSVQNSAGQVIQGVAGNLQVQNGEPTFDVAGKSYTLASLVGVAKAPYV